MEIGEALTIFLAFWSISSFLFNIIFVLFLEGENSIHNNSRFACFWYEIWVLKSLSTINKFGRVIIEILYTIFSLPFLVIYNAVIGITYFVEFLILKPFIFVFRKREKTDGRKN